MHELFHAAGYLAAQKGTIDGKINAFPYRSGITLFNKDLKKHYFSEIEEALIAELAERFVNDCINNNPELEKEITFTGKLKFLLLEGNIISNVSQEQKDINKEIIESIFYLPNAEYVYQKIQKESYTGLDASGYIKSSTLKKLIQETYYLNAEKSGKSLISYFKHSLKNHRHQLLGKNYFKNLYEHILLVNTFRLLAG